MVGNDSSAPTKVSKCVYNPCNQAFAGHGEGWVIARLGRVLSFHCSQDDRGGWAGNRRRKRDIFSGWVEASVLLTYAKRHTGAAGGA